MSNEDIKKQLANAVDNFYKEFSADNFSQALKHADFIRNIGLQLGGEAWNSGMEVEALRIKTRKK